ncbi:MAG: Divalent-cation tolerance protein CutA [Alphaproteobacteria bacterium MarineAlpha11_Bin1]|nr:MAG: Divalent-cation tolerance protein CutA [Alphaproteobacteria bacterium MarineAlpha11_Bin1]|tara:strand:- start:24083 stop:24406 length:324 start_codon:yes stop_codon:yes gene_type:complete
MTNDIRLIYITTGSAEEARKIGRTLVDERLAACVNILGPVGSIFRWDGEIKEGTELVLIAKTTLDRVDSLTETVNKLHSYDCPCVASFPIEGGNSAFMKWVEAEINV